MGQPYLGEIRMFAGNFAPTGWAFCNGAILPISENETLFNLIGTTYGGDGQSTFALPDLQGRLPVHMGGGFTLAETGGVENVTLTVAQIPSHSHPVVASGSPGYVASPANAVLARDRDLQAYNNDPPSIPMRSDAVGLIGDSQPHENMPPYLCISFIISLFGVFPTQS